MTPVTSKVKKIEVKSYSSFKSKFRTMNDGKICRWHEGKLHNVHLKILRFIGKKASSVMLIQKRLKGDSDNQHWSFQLMPK
ncbi:hypothetical protein EZV62_001593 [Acer yangbiense]|uniref:Uncharacterized protein n=1 Tax=Acer yangbiense TaxID=1000413 RepID=A0A5C7IVX3_9ROSI|nr:hypothetical protein EZV62_001593 [Acer yangbiense]